MVFIIFLILHQLAYLVKNDFRPGDKAKLARFADGPCNNSIKNEVTDKGKCRTTFLYDNKHMASIYIVHGYEFDQCQNTFLMFS